MIEISPEIDNQQPADDELDRFERKKKRQIIENEKHFFSVHFYYHVKQWNK